MSSIEGMTITETPQDFFTRHLRRTLPAPVDTELDTYLRGAIAGLGVEGRTAFYASTLPRPDGTEDGPVMLSLMRLHVAGEITASILLVDPATRTSLGEYAIGEVLPIGEPVEAAGRTFTPSLDDFAVFFRAPTPEGAPVS